MIPGGREGWKGLDGGGGVYGGGGRQKGAGPGQVQGSRKRSEYMYDSRALRLCWVFDFRRFSNSDVARKSS